jgi:hypothetical protein
MKRLLDGLGYPQVDLLGSRSAASSPSNSPARRRDEYATLKSAVIGAFGSEMIDGGVSRDSGRPPPPPMGDFPAAVPAGSGSIPT